MRRFLCWFLAVSLAAYGAPAGAAAAASTPAPRPTLAELLQEPYVTLFEQAPELDLTQGAIEEFREQLEEEKEQEKESLEEKKDSIEDSIDESQSQLKELNGHRGDTPETEERRHELHCRIQQLRKDLQETKLALDKGLEIKYDNQFAKLKILAEWPQEYREIQQELDSGQVRERKFSDFRDVGFRNGTFEDQADDVKRGREAIEEMKRMGILPPEVDDEEVVEYVRKLGSRLARHSDLQVPLHISVLRSKEINAFALPGGFMFVNSGLILQAEKESELAGVIAHEIAHIAARHGHKLMKRATIASIIYQAAQVAALIFTGGIASIGLYYALQYGFFGLGLILNLQLLGVSRDYEVEADILGTQYLWHAGYNTRGFISFFDRMAQEKGYITGLSWFRTHPPFYQRMERTFEEITILPEQKEAVDNTSDFREAKERLERIMREMEKEDREAPTLRRVYECEDQAESASGKEQALLQNPLPACGGALP